MVPNGGTSVSLVGEGRILNTVCVGGGYADVIFFLLLLFYKNRCVVSQGQEAKMVYFLNTLQHFSGPEINWEMNGTSSELLLGATVARRPFFVLYAGRHSGQTRTAPCCCEGQRVCGDNQSLSPLSEGDSDAMEQPQHMGLPRGPELRSLSASVWGPG